MYIQHILIYRRFQTICIQTFQILEMKNGEILLGEYNIETRVKLAHANSIIKHIASTNITGDDKETLSLLLFMGLLKVDGTACVVLKEGVFFNEIYMKLRKVLCENYNVTHIMSVPRNDFWNTTTKTSVLIFHNNGKTEKVVFSEINYTVDKNNNKETIFETHPITKDRDNHLIVDYKDIVYNKYSLNYKDYWNAEIKVKKGFKIVKLKEICKIVDGYAFKNNEYTDNGVRLIKISNINNLMIITRNDDVFINYDEKYNKCIPQYGDIIIGMTGNISKKIAIYYGRQTEYLNQRVCKLTNFIDNNIKIYLYYYWISNNIGNYLQSKSTGSIQVNLSKKILSELEIPIPEDIYVIK